MKRFFLSLLCLGLLFFLNSCESNYCHGHSTIKEDSLNANLSFSILQKYLPYNTGDTRFFLSDSGERDTLVCHTFPYFSNDSSTFFVVAGDGDWSCGIFFELASPRHSCSFEAMASGYHYKEGITYELVGYLGDTIRRGERGFYKKLPHATSIVELYPEIIMNRYVYSSSSALSSNSYMKLLYDKGLTEFSLDGQEIWRLVE